MPRLVETYALSSGFRIDKMGLHEEFFPLGLKETDKYIVVVTSTGMPAKNYSYFKESIRFIKDNLHQNGYTIVQCGTKDDARIEADIDICGFTNIYQLFYLIKHASLVVCGDTSVLHAAGHYNVPVVSIFGITSPKITGAYFGDKSKQIYIEPNYEEGVYPSFNPNESPKQIDTIMPEKITEAIGKLLKIPYQKIQSLIIGEQFNFPAIELIPDHIVPPNFAPRNIINVRYDYGGQEKFIFEQTSVRKTIIIINRSINIEPLIALRPNIEKVVYEIDKNHDPAFARKLQLTGIPLLLISYLDNEELNPLKLDYVEIGRILQKRKHSKEDLNEKTSLITNNTKFRTNKVILSQGKGFLSRAHIKEGSTLNSLSETSGNIVDDSLFWQDLEFYHIYNLS